MLLEFFGRFKRPQPGHNKDVSDTDILNPQPHGNIDSFFPNASGIVINQPQFGHSIVNSINSGKGGLDHLLPYVCSEAAVDSSARHPPPLCHPGTRERIQDRLATWLDDPKRQRKMIWLSGPAGTGKSAVAQSFAELCLVNDRLGAAFFFSRLNHWDKANTVVPTLAYQLAIHFPNYRPLLVNQIAHDPTIVKKSPPAQFKRLIVEPFSILQLQGHSVTQEPLLILLDGLDECQDIPAQCEFVEMIGEVIRLKKDLPLLWLICSRPEPHLKYIFLRSDFGIDCDREELVIDAETRDDVDKYLAASFAELRSKFWDVTDPSWPSDGQFSRVSKTASGLFILASTIVRYLGDPVYANPTTRLIDFLQFMENAHAVGTKNPLEALDLFYSNIFSQVPGDILPTTKRLLGHYLVLQRNIREFSACVLCNFLNIDQTTFYGALRKLHSVVKVLPPEEVNRDTFKFYHASFQDYLWDPSRSGKFGIDWTEAQTEMAKSYLFWYKIDLISFHAADTEPFDTYHRHAVLPGLKWAPPDRDKGISHQIELLSEPNCWRLYNRVRLNADVLVPQLQDFDFRYINLQGRVIDFLQFADWLWELGPLNTVSWVEPRGDFDIRLLDSLKWETRLSKPMEVADFPLLPNLNKHITHSQIAHFFIGQGEKTCLFWYISCQHSGQRTFGRSRFPGWENPTFKDRNRPLQYIVTSIRCESDGRLDASEVDHRILTLWRARPQWVDGRMRRRVLGSYSYPPQPPPSPLDRGSVISTPSHPQTH